MKFRLEKKPNMEFRLLGHQEVQKHKIKFRFAKFKRLDLAIQDLGGLKKHPVATYFVLDWQDCWRDEATPGDMEVFFITGQKIHFIQPLNI